ncbi:MAG: amino acid permease, partial [Myxococcaceae bacterium]
AAAGCLGSLGGWVMATGLTAKAAADDGLFPKIFGASNEAGTPVKGLLIVAVLMSVITLLTMSPSAAKEFGTISSIAVLMTLVAYIYVAAALLGIGKLNWKIGAIVAITLAYCSWALLGSSHYEVAWLAVILLVSTAFYKLNNLERTT